MTTKQCKQRIKDLIAIGQPIVIVNDNDNVSYTNGWADYLFKNYNYDNFNSGLRVNLENPKEENAEFWKTRRAQRAENNAYGI